MEGTYAYGPQGPQREARGPVGAVPSGRGVPNHIWALESAFFKISNPKLVFNHLTSHRVTDWRDLMLMGFSDPNV